MAANRISTQPISKEELRRSINLNILGITMGMVFFTIVGQPIGSPIFSGFMRKLGAGDFVYSLVMALPILGGVAQVAAASYIERTGRRKLVFLVSGFVHRLLWLPVAFIPLLTDPGAQGFRIWTITALITVSAVSSAVNGIAFNSWMGSLIPTEIAGRFFGRRTLISTISAAVTALLAGEFIDHFTSFEGFGLAFTIAVIFGTLDISCFFAIKHPSMTVSNEKTGIKARLTEPFKNSNYTNLILFASLFNFGVNIVGPFFNLYTLEDLHLSYFEVFLTGTVASAAATTIFARFFGVLIDKYGNKPVMFVCGFGASFLPLLWLLATERGLIQVAVVNFFSGIAWTGFNIAILNQTIWLAPEKNRSAYMANFALITSVLGTALPYVCGGIYMEHMRPIIKAANVRFILGQNLNAFHVLLVISTVMRLLAVLAFVPRIYEENAKPESVMLSDFVESVRMWHLKVKAKFKRNI